jgi:DNA-binding MarR family transcriptional regulator
MRCSHCHSGRMKRAENFGAERMQCGSCGIVTKSAETRVSDKQQELINYLSGWLTERIESAWEVTQDLDQNGISKAINISRSNVPRLVEPLITAGLVRKKKAHILDENNRVTSRMKKWVYYLTREGRKHVTESRRAETFEADDIYGVCSFCGYDAEAAVKYQMKQNNEELTDEEYDEEVKFYLYESHPDFCKPMQKYVDTFQAEEPFICPECRRASTKSKTSQVCVRCESEYQAGLNPPMRVPWPGDDGYYAETFEASRSDLRRRRRTPFYKIGRTDEDEDHDQNKYARTNAGGALWEATYQALRDDGRSHGQAEAFCNSKFFDHYYEALIEGLRRPMRKVLKDIRRANRKAGRDFDKKYLIDEFIFDNQVFNAHEGGHFEAPNRYPVRPTRPSEDWPRPTPRPRRPNRRPNPRPRPARRPF